MHVSDDVLAGVTLAALGIPEVLGYAKIAGMRVMTGLYTLLLPMAVFAVLGSSRHLVVAADSAAAAQAADTSTSHLGLRCIVRSASAGWTDRRDDWKRPNVRRDVATRRP